MYMKKIFREQSIDESQQKPSLLFMNPYFKNKKICVASQKSDCFHVHNVLHGYPCIHLYAVETPALYPTLKYFLAR